MKPYVSCQTGVTLLELMVAIAIAGVVMAAMFSFQQGQTKSHVTQEALTGMQQNARAAMQFMTSELRMAGCDPTGTAGARILEASSNRIRFTMDFTSEPDDEDDYTTVPVIEINFEDGANPMYVLGVPDGMTDQLGEDITYELAANGNIVRTDHNNDATPDAVIAQNIDALDFVYLDGDGARIGGAGDVLDPNQRGRISSIQVSTIARSGRDVPGFMYRHTDTQTYNNQEGDPLMNPNPPNDNFRRILLSTEVRLRNM